MPDLKIFNVKWTSTSAGPSPLGNERTEIFLAGCRIAAEGRPCKGCFNPSLWYEDEWTRSVSPQKAAETILEHAPAKYVTFVGGEPLDQLEALAETCVLLKKAGFNILVITHYTFFEINRNMMAAAKRNGTDPADTPEARLLSAVDILIDGEYREKNRIWDESRAGDGLHDVVGSSNQVVWDLSGWDRCTIKGESAGILDGLAMDEKNRLIFVKKERKFGKLKNLPGRGRAASA